MIDFNLIRNEREKTEAALAKKGCVVDLKPVVEWDAELRRLKQAAEEMKAKRNARSKEIPKIKRRAATSKRYSPRCANSGTR